MNLEVLRKIPSHYSTIGDLSVNGDFYSYCLEPTDRGLTSDMTLDQIEAIKVPKQTCIPDGTYKLIKYNSPKHGLCLCLVDVPGFGYVEIHIGNYPHDTEACLLPGQGYTKDMVTASGGVTQVLTQRVFAAMETGEDCTITYSRAYELPVIYQ